MDDGINLDRQTHPVASHNFPIASVDDPMRSEGFVEPLENRRFSDQASAAKQNLDSTPRISKHCVAKQRKSGVE